MDSHPHFSSHQLGGIIALLSPFAPPLSPSMLLSIDWRQAYDFCHFHGVRPVLAQVVERQSEACRCPDWLTAELADFRKRHAFGVLSKTADIIVISKALEAANVKGIFFKGAVLGEQVYGGAHLREFNDIDLLVCADQRESTADLLKALSFRPIIADQRIRHAFFDYMGQHMFRHAETRSVVDLHWNFVGDNPFPITADEALGNRVTFELGGVAVPAPCIADLSLILAGHGQKESWVSFAWALDFATFVAKFPDFDWASAADRSRSKQSLRPLLTAILLVERLFGHEVDKRLVTSARNQRRIVEDVERIIAGYLALARRKHEDHLKGSFRLCETPLQRVKVWGRLLTTRTIGDYEVLPLPPRWWWAYRLTRPFRLAWQQLCGEIPIPSAFFEGKKRS